MEKNIRMLVDNDKEIVEMMISADDKKYILKLESDFKGSIALKNVTSTIEGEVIFVTLLQENSLALMELACRIQLSDKMKAVKTENTEFKKINEDLEQRFSYTR